MTTIFSAVLIMAIGIAVTLFAILINNAYSKKRTNELASAFHEVATEFHLSFSKIHSHGKWMIGLDRIKNRILYLIRTRKKYEGYMVDLAEIEKCEVKKEYQTNGAAYIKRLGVDALIERVVLVLYYKNGAKPLGLSFYEKSEDQIFEIGKRTHLANKWQSIISTRIKGNRKELEMDSRIRDFGYGQLAGV